MRNAACCNKPLVQIPRLLGAVARNTARNNVPWPCFAAFAYWDHMVPCCRGSGAVGTAAFKLLHQTLLSCWRQWLYSAFSTMSVLAARRTMLWVGRISSPRLGVRVLAANASANRIDEQPIRAPSAPREPLGLLISALRNCRPRHCTVASAGFADVSPVIVARTIHRELIKRFPSTAFRASLLAVWPAWNVSPICRPSVFGSVSTM